MLKKCLILVLFTFASAHGQVETFTLKLDKLLDSYVAGGKVDYASLSKNDALLKSLASSYQNIKSTPADERELMAFHINAYNYWVIRNVLKHYPLESVMDVEGFFTQPSARWDGEDVSLNELERLLFDRFPDETRLHLVLVCAARGCPDLANRAFTKDNLRSQLKDLTRDALSDQKMVQLDMHEKKAFISKIFEWYRADFTQKGDLKSFLNYHRQQDIPAGFEIVFMDYDWRLNE